MKEMYYILTAMQKQKVFTGTKALVINEIWNKVKKKENTGLPEQSGTDEKEGSLPETHKLFFREKYVFSSFIPFLCDNGETFPRFFSLYQLKDENSSKCDARGDQNFFGFHINTL